MSTSYTQHMWWLFLFLFVLLKTKYQSNVKALCLPFGYILFCVGIYFVAFAKGKYHCTPLPPWTSCKETPAGWARSRQEPGKETNPDGTPIWITTTQSCSPINCKIGDSWGEWSPCTTGSDNKRTRTRLRVIDTKPQYGGKKCEDLYNSTDLVQTESCNPPPSTSEGFRFRRHRRFFKRTGIEDDPAFGGGIAALVFACILLTLGHLDPPVFLPTLKLIGFYLFSMACLTIGYYYLGLSDGLNECDPSQYSEDLPENKAGLAFVVMGVFFVLITHGLALPLTETTKK